MLEGSVCGQLAGEDRAAKVDHAVCPVPTPGTWLGPFQAMCIHGAVLLFGVWLISRKH